MDEESLSNEGVRPDAPGDLATLESMIAADEATDAQARAEADSSGKARDEQGRFTPQGASARQNAQRAGERQTPEEISAAATRRDSKVQPTGKTQQQPKKDSQQAAANSQANSQANGQPKAGEQAAEVKPNGEAQPADDGKSKYRREVERRERSWEELNKQKVEFNQQKQELELREQTIVARERTVLQRSRPARDGSGFTAADYEAAAPKFEAAATKAEADGDFERADHQRQLAANAKAAAAELKAKNPAGDSVTQSWQKLKSDLPEALNVNSPLNQELRALIQQRPDLLGDEAGPYRVAVLAGRKLVAGLEQKLAAAQAEAGRVPELQQQVSELSARVQELEGLTSPDGDGQVFNRGGGGDEDFHSLSTAEQERRLDRELAGSL